jgi:hypothetical protein
MKHPSACSKSNNLNLLNDINPSHRPVDCTESQTLLFNDTELENCTVIPKSVYEIYDEWDRYFKPIIGESSSRERRLQMQIS